MREKNWFSEKKRRKNFDSLVLCFANNLSASLLSIDLVYTLCLLFLVLLRLLLCLLRTTSPFMSLVTLFEYRRKVVLFLRLPFASERESV